MANQENLPAKNIARDIAVHIGQRGSLVMRGLLAVRANNMPALSNDDDAIYRKARDAYNRITDDGNKHGWGEIWSAEELSELKAAFEVFQRLADRNYGKAYFPLSRFYSGYQSIPENKERCKHFGKLAFDWCFDNQFQNDPEIWNDLGSLYLVGDGIEINYELAYYWFKRAADANDASGMFNLCRMYESGDGVKQNYDKALDWQFKAARGGHIAAQYGLGRQYEHDKVGVEGDFYCETQAFYWYLQAAESGQPAATQVISRLSWGDYDFPEGDNLAYDWYRKQALAGHVWAQWFLAKACRYAGGIEQDNKEAAIWYRMVANSGHAEAQYELARLLAENGEDASEYWLKCSSDLGYGPAQLAYADFVEDVEEATQLINAAFDWHKWQAETGDPARQYDYAWLLFDDHFAPHGNSGDGWRWLKASAKQDYRPACRLLGHKYLRLSASDHSTQQAIFWLTRAADLGDASACESLGDLYLLGHSDALYGSKNQLPDKRVEPNKATAIEWYERGIASRSPMGDRPIAFKLGEQYLLGENLDQDLGLAEKWLMHSATAGYGSAQDLLGNEYLSGARLKPDTSAAIHWLELAGKSSVAVRLKLAEIYLDGIVVGKDFERAIILLTSDPDCTGHMNRQMSLVTKKCFDGRFSVAEEQKAVAWLGQMANIVMEKAHNAGARFVKIPYFHLAELYELGLGIEQDMSMAIHWYRKSAEQGGRQAQKRLHELGIDWNSPDAS